MAGRRRQRRGFGKLRKLPSGRYQASYVGPDLARHTAPDTFDAKEDAEAWLALERRLIGEDDWTPPKTRRKRALSGRTLADYAPGAIPRRTNKDGEPLRPRTQALYQSILRRVVLPALGPLRLRQITPEIVADWYRDLDPDKPTQRAHAYALLRAVMNQAIEENLITENPCRVRGAGRTSRKRRIEIATPDELAVITENMPQPLRLLVMLACWCSLRFGELAELRRGDVNLRTGRISVSRAVARVHGQDVVGRPKSAAGERDVAVPPHLHKMLADHLRDHVAPGRDALLFPRHPGEDRHLIHTELTKTFAKARAVAGREDLRLHDLRHTGAVLAARSGATLRELMDRLGHSTTTAARRYQHAAEGRDAEIAAAMSKMTGWTGEP